MIAVDSMTSEEKKATVKYTLLDGLTACDMRRPESGTKQLIVSLVRDDEGLWALQE